MTAIRSFDISSANGYFSAGNVTSNGSAESSDVNKTFSDVFDNLEHVDTAKTDSGYKAEIVKTKKNDTEMAEDNAMEDESYENVIEDEIDKKEEKTVTEMLDDYIHLASEALTQVAESLGITPEQLVDAIEKSGISPEDLLTPDGMKALFVELNGLQDPVDIILDEELHGKFKEVMNVLKDVTVNAGEFDFQTMMDSEGFSSVMDKISDSIENEIKNQQSDITNEVENQQSDITNEVENQQSDDVTYDLQPEGMVPEEVKETSNSQQSFGGSERDDSRKDSPMGQNEFVDVNNAVNGISNGFDNVVNNISEAISNQYGYVTAENIVNQITEQIKLFNGNNFSSIELTLNPESLGKVNIQVVAKDGAVTAQIVAETEMAKNAIESHISELKDTLSNQNIKVDAVEVTIASYEFNENAEGNREQQDLQQTRIRRRVSLDEFFADEESEETEEIIMEAEGSTVSYSV